MIRNLVSVSLLLVLCAAPVFGDNVLIVGSPFTASWNSDVQAKIAATGKFASVDIFNSSSSTPTLAQLDAYSAVLAYTDTGAANPTGLGNVLADYADQGHGLVLAVFAVASVPIGGRLQSGGYYPINPLTQSQGIDLHLGTVLVPTSPIMTGVTSFDGGSSSYYGTGTVAAGATLVADWSNGAPLVAYKGNVVGLNFYPPSSSVRSDFWTSGTQGGLLMANALQFAAGGPSTSAAPLPTTAWTGVALLGCIGCAQLRRRRDLKSAAC